MCIYVYILYTYIGLRREPDVKSIEPLFRVNR